MGWRQRRRSTPTFEEVDELLMVWGQQRREATGRLYATAAILYRNAARLMAEGFTRPIDFDDDVRALGEAIRRFEATVLGEKGDRDGG
jgi:hypothetical protein